MSEIIKLENVSFDYSSEYDDIPLDVVIKDVSLTIERGSFVAVLGHNGSGKSTLAKLFNGILTPKSGRVLVDGMDTSKEELIYDIRRRVGMVFQNPDNQIVATTVEEDVAFAPENLGIEPSEIRRRVDEALAAVNMTEYKKHSPSQLSGGQKQRVAIAGIIAMKPECIIFDESTAMLDPQGRKEVLDTIMSLKKEGMTVVLITHYMNEAVFADRVIVMNDGNIEMDASPRDVFSKVERLKSIGLDVPQTTELVNRLIADGYRLSPDLLFPDEGAKEIEKLISEHTQR
ncbi:MAG: energy-coupling factor transporter ATPase [Clostridia bacterium]|nr:energy-coupling factor transporter ATPase [Clostridia bacterium]